MAKNKNRKEKSSSILLSKKNKQFKWKKFELMWTNATNLIKTIGNKDGLDSKLFIFLLQESKRMLTNKINKLYNKPNKLSKCDACLKRLITLFRLIVSTSNFQDSDLMKIIASFGGLLSSYVNFNIAATKKFSELRIKEKTVPELYNFLKLLHYDEDQGASRLVDVLLSSNLVQVGDSPKGFTYFFLKTITLDSGFYKNNAETFLKFLALAKLFERNYKNSEKIVATLWNNSELIRIPSRLQLVAKKLLKVEIQDDELDIRQVYKLTQPRLLILSAKDNLKTETIKKKDVFKICDNSQQMVQDSEDKGNLKVLTLTNGCESCCSVSNKEDDSHDMSNPKINSEEEEDTPNTNEMSNLDETIDEILLNSGNPVNIEEDKICDNFQQMLQDREVEGNLKVLTLTNGCEDCSSVSNKVDDSHDTHNTKIKSEEEEEEDPPNPNEISDMDEIMVEILNGGNPIITEEHKNCNNSPQMLQDGEHGENLKVMGLTNGGEDCCSVSYKGDDSLYAQNAKISSSDEEEEEEEDDKEDHPNSNERSHLNETIDEILNNGNSISTDEDNDQDSDHLSFSLSSNLRYRNGGTDSNGTESDGEDTDEIPIKSEESSDTDESSDSMYFDSFHDRMSEISDIKIEVEQEQHQSPGVTEDLLENELQINQACHKATEYDQRLTNSIEQEEDNKDGRDTEEVQEDHIKTSTEDNENEDKEEGHGVPTSSMSQLLLSTSFTVISNNIETPLFPISDQNQQFIDMNDAVSSSASTFMYSPSQSLELASSGKYTRIELERIDEEIKRNSPNKLTPPSASSTVKRSLWKSADVATYTTPTKRNRRRINSSSDCEIEELEPNSNPSTTPTSKNKFTTLERIDHEEYFKKKRISTKRSDNQSESGTKDSPTRRTIISSKHLVSVSSNRKRTISSSEEKTKVTTSKRLRTTKSIQELSTETPSIRPRRLLKQDTSPVITLGQIRTRSQTRIISSLTKDKFESVQYNIESIKHKNEPVSHNTSPVTPTKRGRGRPKR